MALSTLGSGDTAGLVEQTIQRRGADGTPLATAWTALAAAGAALAVVAFFVTWYADVRTANGFYSGWMPPVALILIIAGGLLLVAKNAKLLPANQRVSSDLMSYITIAGGSLLLMLRHAIKGDLHSGVFLLLIPVVALAPFVKRSVEDKRGGQLEIEQVSLGAATIGGALVLTKRLLDAEFATGGWAWGLIAAAAVIAAALMASQYLGILTLFQSVLFVALALCTVILLVLLVQVFGDGWSVLSGRFGEFWSGTLRSQSDSPRLGISQGLAGSFWIAVFTIFLAFPIGIAAAVYLEEYAPRNWFTNVLDIVVRNLAGVPSVVYGLLGLFLFVKGTVVTKWFIERINWVWFQFFDEEEFIEFGQSSLYAGGVTLAILVLPIVIITAAEAVRAVPQSLREGAYGVGATKWEVIRSQVLPFAAPGILTGTLLALARAVGEAAPLILVGAITGRLAPRDSMFSGVDAFFSQFADRFTAMPIVIVGWVEESGRDAGFGAAAGAAIVVLLAFVIAMNSIAVLLRNHFEKKRA
jgi:phosphate transport system permease protein